MLDHIFIVVHASGDEKSCDPFIREIRTRSIASDGPHWRKHICPAPLKATGSTDNPVMDDLPTHKSAANDIVAYH
jgi:hypothetical protein